MSVFIYVTASGDDRILIFSQDTDSGALEKLDEIEAPGRPAPLATDPNHQFLYVARRDANELSSYRIDSGTGGLSLLGSAPLESDPNFLSTDKNGRWLFSAYYIAGRCAVHPIDDERRRPGSARRVARDRQRRALHADRSVQPLRVRSPHLRRKRPQHHIPVQVRRVHGTADAQRSAHRPAGRRAGPPTLLLPSVSRRALLLQRTGMQRNRVQLRLPVRAHSRHSRQYPHCRAPGPEETRAPRSRLPPTAECCSHRIAVTTASPASLSTPTPAACGGPR